ncbi:MAG: hypothetical protein Q7S22_04835 [Candidatus Micrarchaeota archaeon]|nr:hypothetical protein [Candidatus Micrarchaeota archaeon]
MSTLYAPRPIRFLEVMNGTTSPNLRVKLYGVSARDSDRPREELVKAAKTVAFDRLPKPSKPSIPESPLSVAIACVHEARGADFLLLGSWDDNVLITNVFKIDPKVPGHTVMSYQRDSPLCTWDIKLIGFERDAWVEKVLKSPTTAGIEAYLSLVLNAVV